jgi:hypothetical protein
LEFQPCGPAYHSCSPKFGDWCFDAVAFCEELGLDLSDMGGANHCDKVAALCISNVDVCQICAYIGTSCYDAGKGEVCDLAHDKCLCIAGAAGRYWS